MLPTTDVAIIGYSGHAFVVCEALQSQGTLIAGYCEIEEKEINPYKLRYLGSEENLENHQLAVFVGIGNNQIREKITNRLIGFQVLNAIHAASHVSPLAKLFDGILICANATINLLAQIGQGAILNTGCIVEHECRIGDFAHIAPGAVLAGNVQIGKRSFIGANSVVKQGINIGKDVTIGAGSVVIRDVPDGATVVGNPGRIISGNQKFKPLSA